MSPLFAREGFGGEFGEIVKIRKLDSSRNF